MPSFKEYQIYFDNLHDLEAHSFLYFIMIQSETQKCLPTNSTSYSCYVTPPFAGVALPLRKIASLQNPSVLLVDNGDGTFKVDTITAFKTHSVQFKLDEELDEDTPDGRKVKVSLEHALYSGS